jgi:ABC-2 type transport system permease protein
VDEFALYRRLIAGRIRSDWQYRTSFFTFLTTQILVTALEFVALVILVRLVPTLGGWSPAEVAFLYAVSAFGFGTADLFVSPVERISTWVQTGTFDRLLLRPAPALLQLCAFEFELRRVGKLVPAVLVLGWAVPNVGVEWTTSRVLVLAMALVCATLIYGSLWVLTSSFSFWAIAAKEAQNAVTYGGQFANEYPLHLYRDWIRATLGWGIPLAFVSYVPTQHLLGSTNPLGMPSWLVATTPAVTLAVLAVAVLSWSLGIRHYQSTGS